MTILIVDDSRDEQELLSTRLRAAGYGSLANLELLISKGADVNAKNRRSSTPLHWAIHDQAKVRLLLSKGAEVNARQAQGRTPIFLAAMLGDGVAE